jgi:hypothetical protein
MTITAQAVGIMVDMDPRERIKARLKNLGKSNYWLAQQVKDHMTPNTVYAYLRGDTDMKGENLGQVCMVLGLDLYPKNKK